MKLFGSSWQNQERVRFYVQGWEPDKKPKGVVALAHGLGEHVARYADVGEAFTAGGYALVGFDLRGHGRSSGRRGHAPSYESLMNDLAEFLEYVARRYPRTPRFLYGHSLGGSLVLNYVLRRKPRVRGAIVTAPWLRLVSEPPAWQVWLARTLNRIAPGVTVKWGLDTKTLSREAQVVEQYDNDPLVHDRVSVRLFVESAETGRWLLEHAAEFPLPLLLMQGSADQVTSPAASREFAQRARRVTTWRLWDGWFHEIHNEAGKARVFRVMITWMNNKLKRN